MQRESKICVEEASATFWERLDDRTERTINTLPKSRLIEKADEEINSGESMI